MHNIDQRQDSKDEDVSCFFSIFFSNRYIFVIIFLVLDLCFFDIMGC